MIDIAHESERPVVPIGTLWCDTGTEPPTYKQWNGTEWVAVTLEALKGLAP